MSLLNVSVNVVAYADGAKSQNPRIKFHDSNISMLGLPTDNFKTININLAPGEETTIESLARSLSYTGLTSFEIAPVGTSHVRLKGNFGARTSRPYGDATTTWAIARTNELVTMTFTGTGTAPTFGSIQAGDGITLESAFSPLNQGDFTIVKVGVDYVQFNNPIATNETVASKALIYSNGPVQVGDTLDISSSAFAQPNRGQFEIIRVTSEWVEFNNTKAVAEAGITGVSSGLNIYPSCYKWLYITTANKIIVKLNGDTGLGTEVEPPVEGDLVKSPGIFLKRGKVFSVKILNSGINVAKGYCILAE